LSMLPPPPPSTLFPYTTLFRSEAHPLLALRRLAEQFAGSDLPSACVRRPDQAFVSDGTAMGEAVDRLEMARQAKLVALAAFAFHAVFFSTRRSMIPRVHGAEKSSMSPASRAA